MTVVAGVRPPALTFVFKKLSTWQWIRGHVGYFASLGRTHLFLALSAVVIGFVVALPLGVVCARVRRVGTVVLAVTTVLYSIPSIAAIAVLLAVTGLSDWTVILPLATYALALLVRSVADGLANVPDEVRVAATAMGFRPWRLLVGVELPTAAPVVIAGLRVATVSSISLVTVGSLIGRGALGQLFIAGENADFQAEIVVGVVLVAVVALVLDALLVTAGWLLTPWARRSLR